MILLPVLVTVGVIGARWLNQWLESTRVGALLPSVNSSNDFTVVTSGDPVPVLVVGGAGYIGSIVVRKLLDRGMHVRLLDKLTYGDSAIASLLGHPCLEFLHGDCRNIQDVVRAMSGVRDVIHLAAIVGSRGDSVPARRGRAPFNVGRNRIAKSVGTPEKAQSAARAENGQTCCAAA